MSIFSSFKESFSKEVFLKFPIVLTFMVLASFFAILHHHELYIINKDNHEDMLWISIFSIVSMTSLVLYFEDKNSSFIIKKAGAYLAMFALTCISVVLYLQAGFFFALFLILLLCYSKFLYTNSSNEEILKFILHGVYSVVFSFISSAILAIGIRVILLSIEYLFEVKILNDYIEDIFIVIGFIIFPFLVLSNLIKYKSSTALEEELKPAFLVLIKNILIPLIFVYAGILYAYFGKVAFLQELPKGDLAWMICSFATAGLFLKLLLPAIKNKNRFIEFYDNFFFYSMIVPLIFLYLSIIVRVLEYGVTQPRYALIMLAVWFTFITLAHLVKKDLSFKYIFASLSILLLIASVSPFNASTISIKSQMQRLVHILENSDILQDSKVVPAKKSLSVEKRAQISSVLYYLTVEEEGLEQINALFNKEFKNKTEILKYINVKHASIYDTQVKQRYIEKFETHDLVFDAKGYNFVLPLNIGESSKKFTYGKNSLDIKLKESILDLRFKDKKVSFDLKSLVEKWNKEGLTHIDSTNYQKASLKSDGVKLQINYMDIRNKENSPDVLFLEGLVFIK